MREGISSCGVAFAVHDFVYNVISFNLYQPRMLGERDEVILELAPVAFRKVDTQGQCHGCRHGITVAVHGTGSVHYHQRVFPAGIVRQSLPRYIQRFAVFRRTEFQVFYLHISNTESCSSFIIASSLFSIPRCKCGFPVPW